MGSILSTESPVPAPEPERLENVNVNRRNVRKRTNRSKTDKKTTVQCSACLDNLDGDHGGIQCVQGHHLCLERCSKQFVDNILCEPHNLIPVKCPTCRVELSSGMMQRVMTAEQLDKYLYYILQLTAKTSKHEGEIFCMCPYCKYFEYREAVEDDLLFIYCLDPNCTKISCFVCKLSLDVKNEEETDFHLKCSSLRSLKNEFEQVLHQGVTVACPQCGLAGMKDNSCSHMHCPSCNVEWCYVCGKTQIELGIVGNFYSHFDDWQTNEGRCPMYLHYINNINDTFPDDDEKALQKFHENRSKMLLKGFVDKIGEATFNELGDHFQSVKNCGFSLQDIRNAPTHVFRSRPCTQQDACIIS